MTNNEFYANHYKPYQENNMTKGTSYIRCNIIEKRLLSSHGTETPESISNSVINGIYDSMESEGLRQNTVFGTYAALYSFFRMAVELGAAEENPVKLARTIRADTSR